MIITELDKIAFKLYVDYMSSEFCLTYRDINSFIELKK